MKFSYLTIILGLSFLVVLNSCDDTWENSNTCGNGVLDSTESCDGELFNGATCTSLGFTGGNLLCTKTCNIDLHLCEGYSPDCGNNTIDGTEQCDSLNLNSSSCESLGYESGTLLCNIMCRFDSSGCIGSCPVDCLEGTKRCHNNSVELCTKDDPGVCYNWVVSEDCSESDTICSESGDNATCQQGCETPCELEGEVRCSSDALSIEECVYDAENDCFEWNSSLCGNENVCSTADGTTQCIVNCISDCGLNEINNLNCSDEGFGIDRCVEVNPGCYQWVEDSLCNEGTVCNRLSNTCDPQGTGEFCDSLFIVPHLPYTLDGTDFNGDFSNDSTSLGEGNGCVSGGEGGDFFLSIFLKENEAVFVSNSTSLPIEFNLKDTCDATSDCLFSGDFVVFISDATGYYYLSGQTWNSAYTGDYSINIENVSVLDLNDECSSDYSQGVCGDSLFCTADASSSTGFSCHDVGDGDNCSSPAVASTGFNGGVLQGMKNYYSPDCNSEQSVEQVWEFTPSESATFLISMQNFSYDSNLYLKTSCSESSTALACVSAEGSVDASFIISLNALIPVYIVAEKATVPLSYVNPYSYSLLIMKIVDSETGNCGDGMDNDLDSLSDCGDPDCFGDINYCMAETYCGDGFDNDSDSNVDCDDTDCILDSHCLQKRGYYQLFEGSGNSPDIEGWRIEFTPSGINDYTYQVTNDASYYVVPGSLGSTVQVLDDFVYYFDLPFSFPFYGFNHNKVYVSSNGWLSFEEISGSQPFESAALMFEHPMIAVLWDDLNKINFGDNFYIDSGVDNLGTPFWAFTFENREYNNPDHLLSAQVVIFEDGHIRIDYVQAGTEDGLVGISAPGNDPIPSETEFVP